MPKMVDIEARDIYFLLEFSLKEIKLLLDALDMAEIKYDDSKLEQKEARDYLLEFDKFLVDLYEKATNAPNNK